MRSNDVNTRFMMPSSSLILEKKDTAGVIGQQVNSGTFDNFVKQRSLELSDLKIIMETLPDIEWVKRIKTAACLSPKEITNPVLKVRLQLPSDIKEQVNPAITNIIEEHFRSEYDLEAKLSDILGKVLFDHGSYTILTLPPAALDKVLAGGARPAGESLEQYESRITAPNNLIVSTDNDFGKSFEISDNILALRKNQVVTKKNSDKITNMFGGESLGGIDFTAGNGGVIELEVEREADTRDTNPVTMYIPPDATIPVVNPTDPSSRVGVYVAIDPATGLALSHVKDSDVMDSLETLMKKGTGELNMVLDDAFKRDLSADKNMDSVEIMDVFEQRCMKALVEAMEPGMYGEVAVPEHTEVYRIMLARLLKKKKTKLVFVPNEYVTYFALEFNELGQGVSLIEKTKLYASLRTHLLITDVMANIKNSTPVTTLDVTLDADDDDQLKSIETVLQTHARVNRKRCKIGHYNPSDVIDNYFESNTRVVIDGGDVFPQQKVSVTDEQRQVITPSIDFMEYLAKKMHAGLRVPSELVDRALEGNFAISTHTSNHLYAIDNNTTQHEYGLLLREFIIKYTLSSTRLLGKLEKVRGDLTMTTLLNSIRVVFPSHDTGSVESLKEEVDAKHDLVMKMVEFNFSDEMLETIVPDSETLEDVGPAIRAQFVNYFMRDWTNKEGIMPEINGMLYDKEGMEKIGEHLVDWNEGMVELIGEVIRGITKTDGKQERKTNKVRDKANERREGGEDPEETPAPADNSTPQEEGTDDPSGEPAETDDFTTE